MEFESEGPQLGFDRLLADLVEQGSSILATRSRLRELIGVHHELSSELDLQTVLQRIVDIGVDLVGATDASLGVLAPDGSLERFVRSGRPDSDPFHLEDMPWDAGLLGDLIDEQAVRLNHIPKDLVDNDVGIESFLGVPIVLRDQLFGNLYLTGSLRGAFSTDDEELAVALADSASVAIENARLYDDSRHRERVATVIVENSRLMARDDAFDAVEELLTRARELVDIDLVSIAMLTESRADLVIDHALGLGAESALQATYPIKDSPLREAMMNAERSATFDGVGDEPSYGYAHMSELGPLLTSPFTVGNEIAGFLCAVRTEGRPAFTERDTRTIESFAAHLTVIYERNLARDSRQRLSLLEDRERIARDLHDHVIQRLFATGMNLQVAAGKSDEATGALVEQQIEEIDGAIAQIRQSIFAIRASEKSSGSTLRARIMEIIERRGEEPVRPTVTFLGPVDLMVDGGLTDDVVAAVAEGLDNAARHAHASAISMTIQAGQGRVRVDVIDDGVGMELSAASAGLANLRRRAEARDGALTIESDSAQGTHLTWVASTF